MRPHRTTTALALLLCLATAALAHPVPRTVLLETFTNVSCAGCADANQTTAQAVDDLGNTRVINLQTHLNWPAADDPFYQANPGDHFIRAYYNGIANAPDLVTNGENTPTPGSYAGLVDAVTAHHDVLSPLSLAVEHTLNGSDLSVSVGVKTLAAPPAGDLRLFVALVDVHEHVEPAPGDNGETDFRWTMRDLVPDYNGTAFTIDADDSLVFTLPATVASEWLDTDLEIFAWVQVFDTREVLQAATTAAPPAWAADYYAEGYGAVGETGELHRFDGWLVNRGAQTDTYDIHVDAATPGWQVSACAGTVCYPPWITDFEVTLAPGEEVLIGADVTPNSVAETGVVTLTCTSRGDRDIAIPRSFTLITEGADVLFVDGGSPPAYADYFTEALTATGRSWSAWDRTSLGAPSVADLTSFDSIVWNTEGAAPGLDDGDRAILGTYLDAGGDLLLSGQDLAYSLCANASPHRTLSTQTWYEHYTGAFYQSDDAQASAVTGEPMDPIGEGLSFYLVGGDGADNQDYPDSLAPAGNARTCLEYANGAGAGVRFARGDARMVTLGFGLEGIATAYSRGALMGAVLDWFADTTVAAPGPVPAARLGEVGARPNPFNPATDLVFALEGAGTAAVRIDVYDPLGRRVRRLHDGPLAAGRHALRWDGRDDNGAQVAGGVYLAVVRAGDDIRSLKLSLVK